MPFKSVEELDAKIASLEKGVDSGSMTIVNEKKALAEASNLKKQRKAFSGSDEIQKRIDQKKAENAELKKTFDSKEARELSDKYERNQKELDELKAAKEGTNKSFTVLRAEKDKLYDDQKATYAKIREVKDAFYQGKKAFKEHEDMIYQQKRDRQKAEHNAYLKEKRSKDAQRRLEDASEPAYLDEIKTAKGLIYHFDPSSANKENVKEPGALAASAQRTVDEPEMKGMKVMKKDEEDFFVGGGGKKKGKGGKKAAGASGSKFNIDPGTIESFGRVGVDPPTSQGDVPSVVEKLKEKLAHWEKTQDEQTKKVRRDTLLLIAIVLTFYCRTLPLPKLKLIVRRRRRWKPQPLHPLQRPTLDDGMIVLRKSPPKTLALMAMCLLRQSLLRRKTLQQMLRTT